MRPSGKVTAVGTALVAGCMLVSVLLLRGVDQVRTGATLQEVLYISSPKVLKRLSLGYDGLLADIYWTRAVQYFGRRVRAEAKPDYSLLGPLLEITTTLDPHLIVAYQFGANFLAPKPPLGADMPEQALNLIDHGIQNNPSEWRLYRDKGLIYYLEMKDYARAATAFEQGSELPHAHPFLKLMAAKMAQHAGEADTARMLWLSVYQTTNKDIKANAVAHLRAIQVDEDVPVLEELVAKYRSQKGRLPSSFFDLVSAGMLRNIPIDPVGHPYKLLPDGKVVVAAPDDLPFIENGAPPGYVPPAKPKFLTSE